MCCWRRTPDGALRLLRPLVRFLTACHVLIGPLTFCCFTIKVCHVYQVLSRPIRVSRDRRVRGGKKLQQSVFSEPTKGKTWMLSTKMILYLYVMVRWDHTFGLWSALFGVYKRNSNEQSKNKQWQGADAIRTKVLPSKPKWKINKITISQNTKTIYRKPNEQLSS